MIVMGCKGWYTREGQDQYSETSPRKKLLKKLTNGQDFDVNFSEIRSSTRQRQDF